MERLLQCLQRAARLVTHQHSPAAVPVVQYVAAGGLAVQLKTVHRWAVGVPVDQLVNLVFTQISHDGLGIDVHDRLGFFSGFLSAALTQLAGKVDALLRRPGQEGAVVGAWPDRGYRRCTADHRALAG